MSLKWGTFNKSVDAFWGRQRFSWAATAEIKRQLAHPQCEPQTHGVCVSTFTGPDDLPTFLSWFRLEFIISRF